MSNQQTPQILVKEIQDLYIRRNFQNLVDYFAANNQLVNFKFFEIVETAAVTKAKSIAHKLGFTPKDVIICQATGAGIVSFLFGTFDTNNIYYTTTDACRVRFFVGTYSGDQSSANAKAADTQNVSAEMSENSTVTSATATKAPQFFALKTGTNAKFTVPTGAAYLRVKMVGGGGGGAGSSSSTTGTSAQNGGTGTNTTFGALTAGGGGGGTITGANNTTGGAGGTASLGGGATGTALNGATGSQGAYNASSNSIQFTGPPGAASVFGGAGFGTVSAGGSGVSNSGSGGAGGATNGTLGVTMGSSGGAGGLIDAVVTPVASSYTYTVGGGGGAGSAGSGGSLGGAGGSGYIEVWVYF